MKNISVAPNINTKSLLQVSVLPRAMKYDIGSWKRLENQKSSVKPNWSQELHVIYDPDDEFGRICEIRWAKYEDGRLFMICTNLQSNAENPVP